jgi:predicted AAA+ superfamily ATPase
MDSITTLAAAEADPVGFVRGFGGPVVIDEAQRAPGIMLAIKDEVDRERTPGRFFLTGSADVLALPRVADSLAGRMELLTLYPLSQGEISGASEDFIDRAFDPGFAFGSTEQDLSREALFAAICRGGYPEAVSRKRPERRGAWFDSYAATLVERDVRDISNIHDKSSMIKLISLMAARSATLFNQSELSRSSGIAMSTLSRYISVLEALFLVWFLPAWSSNLGKRLVKSPKIHFVDSGFASHLCGADETRLRNDHTAVGRLVESFVAGEILKQSSWTRHPVRMFHYRSQNGDEIDLLLEDRAGRVVALEIKMAETITGRDTRGMAGLRDEIGENFVSGIVLHPGREAISLGDRLLALPIGAIFDGARQ